jgi:phage repressor protein C with HTH and peptisase S24 domain
MAKMTINRLKNMAEFIDRMKELRGKESFRAIADRIGVKETTLKSWFADATPSFDMAAKVAKAYGKSLDWLYGYEDGHIPSEQIGFSEGQSTFVPAPTTTHIAAAFFEARASAGNGLAVLSQSVEEHFSLPRDWLARLVPANTPIGLMQAVGHSMEPTIRDGDVMIVRFDIDHIKNDGIYIVSYDGEIRVKRLTVNLGEVVLTSDNERHADQIIPRTQADERLKVHGLVFWAGGTLRSW